MTYTHLTTDELVLIEAYYHQNIKVAKIAEYLKRSLAPIYNVIIFLKKGWSPDVIIRHNEITISCSVRTLYHQFKEMTSDANTLPLKGKRKLNGHQERQGKQDFKRNLAERKTVYPAFKKKFGHIEGDTIVGAHHKSTVITLVKRLAKVIITLKPSVWKARDIETAKNQCFSFIPKHLFKTITFVCGKEFSNWKFLSNQHDVAIYFADPRTPSQCGLNEHSNGLLRKDGLPKVMDFNLVDQAFILQSQTNGI